MTQAPGRTLLKVVGILLIIGGVLSVILSLLVLAGGGVAVGTLAQGGAAGDPDAAMGALVGGILVVLGIVGLVAGIVNLIAGILGVKNANVPEKAGACIVMGVIMIILQASTIVLTLISGGDMDVSTIISWAAGFLLPVLYLVGANKNKNAAL